FFSSSRRRHTRFSRDWSSDVCSSDLGDEQEPGEQLRSVFRRAQKLPGLLGEIDEDRGGIEDPCLAGAGSLGVDDSGNLPVRIDQIGRASCRGGGWRTGASGGASTPAA